MSINEIMKVGTNGMTASEKQNEQERRIKVAERINAIGEKIARIDVQLKILPAEYGCCKIWKQKKKEYQRQLRKIKSEEGNWLKEAAWFMYC